MKKLAMVGFCLCLGSVIAKKITDTIHSEKLKQDREIPMGLPANYDKIQQKNIRL